MTKAIIFILVIFGFSVNGQNTNYNTKKGYVAEGFDVVSYFNNIAKEGDKKYTTIYDGVKYKFLSQENLNKFNANPVMYVPQYGGYCAYAIALNAKKVSINPKTFEIRNGKLYLFYNSWGNNTLETWIKESPDDLKLKADKNWKSIN